MSCVRAFQPPYLRLHRLAEQRLEAPAIEHSPEAVGPIGARQRHYHERLRQSLRVRAHQVRTRHDSSSGFTAVYKDAVYGNRGYARDLAVPKHRHQKNQISVPRLLFCQVIEWGITT
jgi:hypothetical protein